MISQRFQISILWELVGTLLEYLEICQKHFKGLIFLPYFGLLGLCTNILLPIIWELCSLATKLEPNVDQAVPPSLPCITRALSLPSEDFFLEQNKIDDILCDETYGLQSVLAWIWDLGLPLTGPVISLSLRNEVMGFPGGSGGKESACNVGDLGSIPGSERLGMATHSNILAWRISMDRGSILVSYRLWSHKKSDTTEQLKFGGRFSTYFRDAVVPEIKYSAKDQGLTCMWHCIFVIFCVWNLLLDSTTVLLTLMTKDEYSNLEGV